ncbi:Prolipoprotein diacylglyceryl transferase, putative [Perkinsus marinus ATCC 50983]|uniref:Prolipoprotein diacylglyceryl transferase, putative n=1 Tax=Perkinsus marinus (strain ATCC 50983 / TXsc) TaxID=423536 RepID=C5LC48_PERM5|nr:Prolipoprotein diacylglyceryl transferase, putative [Perkinsus marinus ATCC 50983]EER05531.1 Prolipoprotein diacylglyceryl transferase, putative [Perkinsus marinus ATCC 50983]|eukprot:XP_002773715.1 Prolipoprotein diacylglyceryl transferase, putative [Perkinsus marinus ATCC 50983]
MAIVIEFARPVLFTVFGRAVYGYGLCMALAFLSALFLGDGELKRKNLKIDSSALLLSAMIGGILGSRLHYVLTWNSTASFWDMSTGHSFQGGLLGGIIGTTGYTKLYCHESIGRMLDTLAPLLLIGHSIGKVGCFISGDGCYGYPTDVPWAMSFPNGLVPTTIPVHPAPLYEMVTSGGVGLLLWLRRKQREAVPWAQMSDMLILLGSTRFFVERYRGHNRLEGIGISQFQVFALGFIVAGVIVRLATNREWLGTKKSEKVSSKKKTARAKKTN